MSRRLLRDRALKPCWNETIVQPICDASARCMFGKDMCANTSKHAILPEPVARQVPQTRL